MQLGLFELLLVVPFLLGTVYWLVMLVDAIRQPEGSYRAGTKVVWVVVIAIVGFIGAIVYQVVGRPRPAAPTA